jgi:hypothetical protein
MPVSADTVNAGALCSGDLNYDAWAYDLHAASVTSILGTAGSVYGSQIIVRNTFTPTNMVYHITTAGSTLTANNCWALLFSNAGTLIGQSANQATLWATAGLQTMPFTTTSPGTLAPGKYWTAVVATGTTLPTFAAAASPLLLCNNGTTGATTRFGIMATSVTTTPATITPSSITPTAALTLWAALQ